MAFIHFHKESTRIRGFSAVSKGLKATVRVEIEVNDPTELGWLMRGIAEAQAELKAPAPKEPASPRRAAPAIEHKPPLQIPFFGGDGK